MTSKPVLLFLAHRIPYPPNKGDKIRSWNLIKHLSQSFSIHLGAFIDDKDDWQYASVLKEHCAECHFVSRHPVFHRLLSVSALFSRTPMSVGYFKSRSMLRWVSSTVSKHEIERVFVFCSPMAQYVIDTDKRKFDSKSLLVDFVDVDSEKWRQYAKSRSWPLSLIYRREASTLLAYECQVAKLARLSFFVSRPELELFNRRASGCLTEKEKEQVDYFGNGVDTDYFAPDHTLSNPFPNGDLGIVFTGAMDYEPNITAVQYFTEEVFPQLRASFPRLVFFIVGSNPTSAIKNLGKKDGVTVTGRVPDVRPYLQHALAAVAPMQIARGVQNKILEALSMGVPVLASPEALTGIDPDESLMLLPHLNPSDYLKSTTDLIAKESKAETLRNERRSWVEANFAWRPQLAVVEESLASNCS